METTLKLKTGFSTHDTEINIDNSTDFKDLSIKQTRNTDTKNTFTETLSLQLSKGLSGEGVTILEIDKFTLIGREVDILKEFLNQY